MKTLTLYQTLKDKDYLSVEENGPFTCRWENTWLGDGYYFWQEFIELAHWWGENHRNGEYIICQAECDFDERCLDLVGNMEHVRTFRDSLKIMQTRGKADTNTTVSRVLRFMQGEFASFNYEAIRVYGINSISPNQHKSKDYSQRLAFEVDKQHYFDFLPAVQICFFTKTALNLRNYQIVYPVHYREDYQADYVV